MAGRFQRIGDGNWPNSKDQNPIKRGIYEWCPGAPCATKDFSIRFLSPDDKSAPRTYYIEPLFRQWLNDDDDNTCFLERACAEGYAILSMLEPLEHPIIYEVAQALFRNRNAGHIRVGRQFTSAADFLDARPGGSPSLLGAGLTAEETNQSRRSRGVHAIAQDLLGKALRDLDPDQPKIVGLSDVLRTYLSHWLRFDTPAAARQGKDTFFPIDELPLRSPLDLLFTDGCERGPEWCWNRTTASVRSALMYGPVTQEDFDQAVADKRRYQLFFENLLRSVQSRSAEGFDRWFLNAREHRYLALVGASRAKDTEREAAAEQAARIACAWMWLSYMLMARCYGALMMVVWLDYCLHSDPKPTDEEKWLFRQWHFPQVYLAGLPLDFLGRAQLRIVLGGLHHLWHNRIYEPEAYDSLTGSLGWFGDLVRQRRQADRERKQEATTPTRGTFHDEESGDQAAQPRLPDCILDRTSPWLEDTNCPACGCRLKLEDGSIGRLDPTTLQATFYCPGCKRESSYLLDETQWQSIGRRARDASGT